MSEKSQQQMGTLMEQSMGPCHPFISHISSPLPENQRFQRFGCFGHLAIMTKSFPVVHDRRQKTGWRRRIVTKEDLAAEESRHRQRPGWAPVLGPYLSRIPLQRSSMFTMCNDSPCLSRTPLQRSSIFINCNNVSLGVNFGSLLNVTILFWLLKNEELVKDFLHLPLSFFSHISLPLKVECWLLEDGKNVEVQNFSGL